MILAWTTKEGNVVGQGEGGTHDAALDDEIRFDRPGDLADLMPYRIKAAGRTTAHAHMPLVRQRFNQHVLILPVSGVGLIRLGAGEFRVVPGNLAWLDTARQYAHGCVPGAMLWRYLWLGVQGHGLEALFCALHADEDPLVPLNGADWMKEAFVAAIDRLRDPGPASAADDSATVARLVGFLVGARGPSANVTGAADTSMAALAARIRRDLAQVWQIADLAGLAKLSPAQLHRRFRQAHGAAPMEWLRRERIHAAKGLLVGTDAKIAAIAADCGYGDPYHFSRDFARLTGQPPSAFRRAGGR